MTLRFKIALALGILAGFSTISFSTIAYIATRNRLMSTVDSYLNQSARQLAKRPRLLPESLAGPSRAELGPTAGPGSSRSIPQGSQIPLKDRPTAPPTILDSLITQVENNTGTIIYDSSNVKLPIDARIVGMAKRGGHPFLETVITRGVQYRMISLARPLGGAFQIAQSEAEDQKTLSELKVWFAELSGVVVAIACLIGWLVAKQISNPLTRLTRATEEAKDSKEFKIPFGSSRRDEAGILARSMQEMVDALDRSTEVQNQLVQDVSHELRTPLTSVTTNIQLLQKYPGLDDQARSKILSDLSHEVGELSGLVNEIVELAINQRPHEEVTQINLNALASRVASKMTSRTGREVNVDGQVSIVRAREGRIERALTNLVDNAIKFSPQQSTVDIIVRESSIEVNDKGPGIPLDQREQIFDRFYRCETARAMPGSGLGLSIVKKVASEHGGVCYVDSREGGGTVIGFTIGRDLNNN